MIKFDGDRFVNNIPVYCVYYFFPLLSLLGHLFFSKRLEYDYFWIAFFPFAFIFSKNKIISKRRFIVYCSIFALVVVKYLLPFCFYLDTISIRPVLMDMKLFYYLLMAMVWVDFVGFPDKEVIYRGGVFFSFIYVLYVLYLYYNTGYIDRRGLIDESNYDGFLILISFCFVSVCGKNKFELFIFLFATFLTLSRTGTAAMMLLFCVYVLHNRSKIWFVFLFPFFFLLLFYVFRYRTSDISSLDSIDRYVYFYQAYLYFENSDIINLIFGVIPGFPLEMPVLDSFLWTVAHFENKNELWGIFPFYFHSTYIRFAIVWGIPVLILYLIWLFSGLIKYRYNLPMVMLLLLIIIQSISLSVFTLSNVTFVLIVSYYTIKNENEEANKKHIFYN